MKAARFLKQAYYVPPKREIVHGSKTGINVINLNLSHKGIAQIAIAVKAGTRHEISDNVAHTLANCKNNTSESHTEFLQHQSLERAGVDYKHAVTREHIVYTLKCGPRLASEMFADVVLPGLFCSNDWHYEVREKEHYMEKMLEHMSAEDKMLDTLHACSFRGSLARSVNPSPHRLGKGWYRRFDVTDDSGYYWAIPQLYDTRVDVTEVKHFRDMTFVHDNITVFTSGLPEEEAQAITDAVAAYTAKGGARVATDAPFVAGESRVNTASAPTGFIGFPGASAGSDTAAAFDIIAQALNGHSFNYEGAGLLALPHSGNGKQVLQNLANLSENDINDARELIATSHAFDNDVFDGAVSNFLNGSFNLDHSSVSNAAVKNLGSSLAKGVKSMVSEGNLNGADFLVDL